MKSKNTLTKALFIMILSFVLYNSAFSQNFSSFVFSFGKFNALEKDIGVLESGIELRANITDFLTLNQIIGIMTTSKMSNYFYFGLCKEIIFDSYFITPSFAIGLYTKGRGKDLGNLLEFRSQVEISYIIKKGLRVGMSFNHISNGGFADYNPGVESLSFFLILY
ncbi:MAG: acyloxyacyl hydrolase [Bacteroidetes bacterium]|nr:acyloxyacyl hydrolase [Bacteroidota bacterium]